MQTTGKKVIELDTGVSNKPESRTVAYTDVEYRV